MSHILCSLCSLEGQGPCTLTFWSGVFECGRRFGAISLNLASAAEESGSIPGSPTSWIGSGSRRDCSNRIYNILWEMSVLNVCPQCLSSMSVLKVLMFAHNVFYNTFSLYYKIYIYTYNIQYILNWGKCLSSMSVLNVLYKNVCPQSRLSSKSPVLNVACPQSRVLNVLSSTSFVLIIP